jgi:hypothetical protein
METAVTTARGTFEVTLAPLPTHDTTEGSHLGRMSIDKTFSGELQGTSIGEMLTGMTGTKGSAAYVAMERVSGTLHGRRGTFILHHTGVMHRGAQQLDVLVVPDSGTGGFEGLRGTLAIDVASGVHSYTLEYTLPDGR